MGRESTVSGAVSLGWLQKDSLSPDTQRSRKQQSTKGQHHQRGEAGQCSCASTSRLVFQPQFCLKSIIFLFFWFSLKQPHGISSFAFCPHSVYLVTAPPICVLSETRAPRQSTTKGLGNAQEQADLQITLLCAPPCLHRIAPLPSNSVEFSTFSMINHAPIPTLPFSSTEKRKKNITFLPAKTSAFPRQNPANGKQEKLGCKTKRTQSGIKSWN